MDIEKEKREKTKKEGRRKVGELVEEEVDHLTIALGRHLQKDR